MEISFIQLSDDVYTNGCVVQDHKYQNNHNMIFSESVPPYFEPMSKIQTQRVYLSWGDVGGYSFQNSDVTAFDVQHTEHWAAFIHKCFTPVFIILKLLTLHTVIPND